MNNKFLLLSLVLPLLALSSCADWTTQEPIPVDEPILRPSEQVIRDYKSDIFSRPIVIGMMHGWGEHPTLWLTQTPDSLDVVILKSVSGELTSAQQFDLVSARNNKKTLVLMGLDIDELDQKGSKALDRRLSEERAALNARWAASETEVSAEERSQAIEEMTQRVTKELHDKYLESVTTRTESLLKSMNNIFLDGYSVKLPEAYSLFTPEEVAALLESTHAGISKLSNDYLFAVESPSEAARTTIEQATWVIYDCPAVDPTLGHYTEMAAQWPKSRFIPAIDLSDKKNVLGYPDTKIFSASKTPRERELIHWSATNKSGVAYDHMEVDAANGSYALLRDLINATSLTK